VRSPETLNPKVVPVVEINEITDTNADIDLYNLDAVRLEARPLKIRRVRVSAGSGSVVFHSCNSNLRTRTTLAPGHVAYVVFGPEALGTVNGIPVHPGLMLAAASGAEARFVVNDAWEAITFLMPPENIRRHLRTRKREADFRDPLDVELLEAEPDEVQKLYAWGKQLIDMATAQPAFFEEQPEVLPAIEADLVENLLACIKETRAFEPNRSELVRQKRSLIVKTAEDYVLSKKGAKITLTELCAATGVSERTLEYAFKGVVGLTPVAFLIRLRLHRVRDVLRSANAKSTTVAAEALHWGFWHFGEFSEAYKNCFGELPSETLSRSSIERPDRRIAD
jgi:AraC-like DNA-binding protein